MLTKNVRAAVIAAGALMLAGGLAAQETSLRIAVVDLDQLVAESAAGQTLQNRLNAFQETVQAEGQQLADRAKATQKLIADGANSLSDERLSELQRQLEDETREVRRFRDDKQREGQKIQAEGLRKIEQDLQPVLDQVQQEGNYDLLLNKALGVVVMASDRIDITARVIELFDAAAAAQSGG